MGSPPPPLPREERVGVVGAAPNQGKRGGEEVQIGWEEKEGVRMFFSLFSRRATQYVPIRGGGRKKQGPYFLVVGAKTILHGMFHFSWVQGLNT